ncbi:hypothetical protein Q4R60_08975 [Morganella morganii]|nr:hypothetical protein [Morganella morganii]
MASRLDIEKSRLIYTQDIGWIDRNHALGGDARNLWAQLLTENTTPYYKDYFLVSYDQFMGKFFIKMGVTSCWLVKKGLREEDKKSIALSMMFYISTLFETHQGRFLFSGLLDSDSGFSGEDLISNLLGFYSVIEPRDYWSLIKPVPTETALCIWDHYMNTIQPFNSYESDIVIKLNVTDGWAGDRGFRKWNPFADKYDN